MTTSTAAAPPEQAGPRHPGREPCHRRDLAIAVVVGVVEVVPTIFLGRHQEPVRGFDAAGALLLALGAVALVWRRRAPVTVLAVAFATTLTYVSLGYPQGPIYFALIVSFATVVLAGRRRVAWAVLAAGWLAFPWVPHLVGTEQAPGFGGVLALAAWLLLLGTATEVVRARRERAVDARRARIEEQRARASEERLRIARELHDVVAHNLSLINVQAGTALHLFHEHPEHAERALAAIKEVSKEGLDELRSLLDVLRDGTDAAPRLPTPTLADLEGLITRTIAAGVPIELRIEGARRPLPVPVETAAYRLAQEALTNVVRHAGGAPTVVRLHYSNDELVVQVDDDGPGLARAGALDPGKGLTGMRERIRALGGELETAPRSGGGFRVRARIPLLRRSELHEEAK